MNELLAISQKLTRAADRWPLSEDRRLDVLRLAKRIRNDAMSDLQIELLIIGAAADGCLTVDDYADETGLSRKEAAEYLGRMWQAGTMDQGKQSPHGTGRPQIVFTLAGEFSSKAKNSDEMPLELEP